MRETRVLVYGIIIASLMYPLTVDKISLECTINEKLNNADLNKKWYTKKKKDLVIKRI